MSLIQWKDSYSVKILQFDNQHKKLVGMINNMHDAMSEGKGNKVVSEILQDLIRYTQHHFRSEEELMQKHGYPEMDKHLAEHQKLTSKVTDYLSRFNSGERISINFMQFLTDWLTEHIQRTDHKYTEFFQNKGEI